MGKFQGLIAVRSEKQTGNKLNQYCIRLPRLTQGWSDREMLNVAILVRVHDVQVLILHKSISVGNVVVQMRDYAVHFTFGLIDWFTHLCGD